MTLYADLPGRRTRQLIADAGMLLWVALWIAAGRWTHDTVMVLANPGRWLHGAGAGFEDTMTRAADQVDDLPILADRVAAPFRTAAGAGTDLAAAGQSLISSAERLAVLAGWGTALLPIVVVGGVWLGSRLRFVRQPRRPGVTSPEPATRTCSPCGPCSPSPSPCWRPSARTRPTRGAAGTRMSSAVWLTSSCAGSACAPRPSDAGDRQPGGGTTRVGRTSAAGHCQAAGSASTCSPERMSLTWSRSSSPAPGNQT